MVRAGSLNLLNEPSTARNNERTVARRDECVRDLERSSFDAATVHFRQYLGNSQQRRTRFPIS